MSTPYDFTTLTSTVPSVIFYSFLPAVNIDGGRQAPHYEATPIAPAQYQVRSGE